MLRCPTNSKIGPACAQGYSLHHEKVSLFGIVGLHMSGATTHIVLHCCAQLLAVDVFGACD